MHRLVRLSPFDSAHRRQTSFAGVEVAPVVKDTAEIEINEDDLQVDTYRASGAGGQHVNKTDSAVRITHRPSGIVVQCQNERSQSSNRATAMAMLRAKLLERKERERQEEIAREKGDAQDVNFGSQIRSYVLHPYTMVKDHRTGHEMGDVQRVLDGDLDGFVRAVPARVGRARGLARAAHAWRAQGSRAVIADEQLAELVARALAEDVGSGDVTTNATVAADARARASITQKAPGAIFGLRVASAVFAALDPRVRIDEQVAEGVWREDGGAVLSVDGSARALLTGERTALNFLAHLSGVATMSARAARAVQGTRCRVLDTRKTTPGLRALEKAAVAAGGASNHRAGLYDAILIKENHIAAAGGIAAAVERARAAAPALAATLEVEVRDEREIDEALAAGAPRLLLDNMDDEQLRAAVARVGGRAELEASGGVTLQTLRARAETGVQIRLDRSAHALGARARSLDAARARVLAPHARVRAGVGLLIE